MAIALVMTGLGTILVGSAQATTATNAHCGDTVNGNLTLNGDVGPCNRGDGLVLTGNHYTLNLNGFRVFSNAPLPRKNSHGDSADVVGIHLLGADHVTVMNGAVSGFSAGVAIETGGSNTVKKVVSTNNQSPCIGENATTQAVGTYGDGIAIFSSANNRIINNTANNNGPFSGISVVTHTQFVNQPVPGEPLPNNNLIQGNTVRGNNTCFADIGIRIEGPQASNNTVSNNVVTQSYEEGISILPVNNTNFQAGFGTVCGERITRPVTGTVTAGSNVITLTSGTFTQGIPGSTFGGISTATLGVLPSGTQIASVTSATTGTLSKNATATNTGTFTLALPSCPALSPSNPGNDNNTVTGNTASYNSTGLPGAAVPTESVAGANVLTFSGIVCEDSNGTPIAGHNIINSKGSVFTDNIAKKNGGQGIANTGGYATATCVTGPVAYSYGGINGTFTGNTALNNNTAHIAPSPRDPNGRSDLYDGFGVAADGSLHDPPTGCDNNLWDMNTYNTAFPPCAGNGIPFAAASAKSGSSDPAHPVYPLRGSH